MASAHSIAEVKAAYEQIDTVERYSDRLIGNRYFGVGLDAIVGLVPILGEIYGIVAAVLVSRAAERARVDFVTQGLMSAILIVDVLVSFFVGAGDAVDFVLRGHAWAAYIAQRSIRNTKYFEGRNDAERAARTASLHMGHPKAPGRTVYLGERSPAEWARWAGAIFVGLVILYLWQQTMASGR